MEHYEAAIVPHQTNGKVIRQSIVHNDYFARRYIRSTNKYVYKKLPLSILFIEIN